MKLSPDTVKYHLQKLTQRSIIQKIVPGINFSKIGYQEHRIILHLYNTNFATTPLIEFLQQHTLVGDVSSSVGKLELSFQLYSTSTEEFYRELRELKTRYSFTIKSIESFQILDTITKDSFSLGGRK